MNSELFLKVSQREERVNSIECIILDVVLGTVCPAVLVVPGTGVNPFVAFLIGPADVQGNPT